VSDLLSIGRFARLTGLTVGALRHYDELSLLPPARVDPHTGYRSYRRDQADDARLVRRLRDLGVSLAETRAVLGARPAERRRLLAAHRGKLAAELSRVQRAIHHLNRIIDHEEPIMPSVLPTAGIDRDAHRALAVELFNHTWTLLELPERSQEQVDEMIHAAHASRYHWSHSGEPVNLARGEWQCSRVYAVLGRAEPALWHARRCLDICEAHGIGDFDIAFAYEAMARASRVAGDHGEAERWLARAREATTGVAEEEDRELLAGDLATI
jgi:DNA-binding transcriptional MerR regulator